MIRCSMGARHLQCMLGPGSPTVGLCSWFYLGTNRYSLSRFEKAELKVFVLCCSLLFPCILFHSDNRCNCSSGAEGILDPDECDQDSGQCSCLAGYTGLQCEDCEDGFFTNGTSGCLACACDSFGAVHLLCDRSALF